MLDPMAALGLASNLVQFVEFSIKLLGDAYEIHKSAQGSLQKNLDIEKVAEKIRTLQIKLRTQDDDNIKADNEAENPLKQLCSDCDETAEELLEVLEKLKAQGKRSLWKSMRQAIKTIKGEAAVVELCGRLKRFQDAIELTILVDLRQKLNLQSVANSENFHTFEITTQNIVVALLENRSIFTTAIDAQTVELKEIHQNEAVAAALRHEDVKSTLFATIEDLNELQSYEHGITRQEIAQKAACDAANLRANMDKRTEEIKDLIKATKKVKSVKERGKLKERANAVAVSLAAMDLIHCSLIEILAKTYPNHTRNHWKIESSKAKENINGTQEQVPRMPRVGTEPSMIGHQETALISDTAARSFADSAASCSSLSPSVSRSTMLNTSGNLFELEVNTSEPQQIHSPSLFSSFPKPQMSPNIAYSEVDHRRPISPVNTSLPFQPMPPTMYRGMDERSPPPWNFQPYYPSMSKIPQNGPRYGPQNWPQNRGYAEYGGYESQQDYPPRPPSEGLAATAVSDPETEKKLLAITELMNQQKIEYDKFQKELADKAEKEAKEMAEKIEKAQKELAEKAAKAQKEIDERSAREAAERTRMGAAKEKAIWERKLEHEKKQALANFEEAQRNAAKAAAEQAKKAAKEKAAWERKVEEETKAAMVRGAENARKQLEMERQKEEERKSLEKRAQDELRSRHIMIPWPALWKRG